MRAFRIAFLGLLVPSFACSQTYSIATFAGGGLPPDILGTSVAFFRPQSVATDGEGNLFFADQAFVFRLDTGTGVLTRVAGSGWTGFGR